MTKNNLGVGWFFDGRRKIVDIGFEDIFIDGCLAKHKYVDYKWLTVH